MPIKHRGKTPGDHLKKWNRYKRKIPKIAGQMAVNFFKDNILKRQGFPAGAGSIHWPKRKSRRGGRSLLVKSSSLVKSIRIDKASPHSVQVAAGGGDVPYAKIHNVGGETHPKVTDRMRDYFWRKYKETGKRKYKHMATTGKTRLDVKIPQRKFIDTSPVLNKEIEKRVLKDLKRILK